MKNKTMNTQSNKKKKTSLVSDIAILAWRLAQALTGIKRVLIPVTLVTVLVVGVLVGTYNSSSQSYALTSKCTLSILNGTVEVIIPGVCGTQSGTDGMTLDSGNRVKTSPDSTALLTFFDGSTLKLEPVVIRFS